MKSVMVVDDDFGMTEVLEAILTDAGYEVIAVHDGFEAFAHLEDHTPDLVLLDLMMPGLSGAPVVIVSSREEGVVTEQCADYFSFLRKPFKVDEILDVVDRATRGNTD